VDRDRALRSQFAQGVAMYPEVRSCDVSIHPLVGLCAGRCRGSRQHTIRYEVGEASQEVIEQCGL
jgi:hypothetical protein